LFKTKTYIATEKKNLALNYCPLLHHRVSAVRFTSTLNPDSYDAPSFTGGKRARLVLFYNR